jgi:protein SCO1/2
VRWLFVISLALMLTLGVRGQGPDAMPPQLENVGVEEHLDAQLPLDLKFRDESGEVVTLGDYFGQDDQPVLLTPVYYRCPQLCTLVLNGLVNAMNAIEWTAGDDFRIVTYSFNPEEGPELAEVKKRAYMNMYTRPEAVDGWHFLTGDATTIDRLNETIGFRARRVEGSPDYAHAAAVVFCTPDGRISRYMNDVQFEPRDVRLALIESSEGSIGSPMEKFVLFMCYRYDPDANSYVASAWKIMRLGGLVTVILVAGSLAFLFLKGPKRTVSQVVSADS